MRGPAIRLTEHQKRLATALALIAALIVSISLGGPLLHLLVLTVALLALWEFFSMYWPGKVCLGRKILGLLLGAMVVGAQALGPHYLLVALCAAFITVALVFLVNFGKGNTTIRFGHYSPILHGCLYIPLSLQLALHLAPSEQCLVLVASIAADTGGYYAGKHFGKRKVWPRVSPGKTWAGTVGGIALCTLACTVQGFLGAHFGWSLPALTLPVFACLGVWLCLAAQFGDFFESALKRNLSIKDSGTLLPGHGGILDRIDSLLFVLPAYMLARLLAAAA